MYLTNLYPVMKVLSTFQLLQVAVHTISIEPKHLHIHLVRIFVMKIKIWETMVRSLFFE